jgi:glycosyltransferase involved in cell wall biosynthesis
VRQKPLAITAYPLSRPFKDGLERTRGVEPTYMSVLQLRRLAPLEMVRTLRTLRSEVCLLPIEDLDSLPLVPILHVLAALCAPTRIELVYPDHSTERLAVSRAAVSASRLAVASARNLRAAALCRRELHGLLAQNTVDPLARSTRRVLYLNGNLWFGLKAGGSVGHVAGVANGLVQADYEVELAAAAQPPLLDARIKFTPLQLHRTFGMPHEYNKDRFQRELVPQLRRIVATSEPGFIYERMSMSTYAGVVVSRSTRLPLILEYNGSEAWIARHWGGGMRDQDLALMAEDACLRHAHLLVTVSKALRDELLERGVPAERIVCFPNCIDPEMFDPALFDDARRRALRRGHGIPEDAVVVGFLGSFGLWHGVDVLVRAAKLLVEQHSDWIDAHRVRFLLVGDGFKAAEIDQILSEDERCAAVFTRTGLVPQAQAPEYLAMADVLVSPHVRNADGSPFFGSPTKLFEYMAMAKPIIASDLDQIGEVLARSLRAPDLPGNDPDSDVSELAVLTEPGDSDQLAQAIKFLVEHPDWRARLGENARREVLARYTWSHHVAAILERANELGWEGCRTAK